MDKLISKRSAVERLIIANTLLDSVMQDIADLSEYSDKLWKTAYERGKAEAHPRKGKWKEVQVVIGRYGDFTTKEYECEICGYRQYFPENYCGRCGTRMEESDG